MVLLPTGACINDGPAYVLIGALINVFIHKDNSVHMDVRIPGFNGTYNI